MTRGTEDDSSQPAPPEILEESDIALYREKQAKNYAIRNAVELVSELYKLREAHQSELEKFKDQHGDQVQVLRHETTMLHQRIETMQATEKENTAKIQQLEFEKQKLWEYIAQNEATIRSFQQGYSREHNVSDHPRTTSMKRPAEDIR
jgi:hypothetical protein